VTVVALAGWFTSAAAAEELAREGISVRSSIRAPLCAGQGYDPGSVQKTVARHRR